MRYLLLIALIAACSDSTAPLPLPDLLPGDGVVRFTLGSKCPTMELAFGIGDDGTLRGPETLGPGEGQDYAVPAATYPTTARAIDGSRTFPVENVTVIAGERVVRTLAC
jgi:hypothetical protein